MRQGEKDRRRPNSVFRRFLDCRRGAVAAMAALMVPVMVAFGVGMAVETGLWYAIKRQNQSAADAGAIAGALEVVANQSASLADKQDKAACAVWRNGFYNPAGPPCPNYATMNPHGVTVNSPATICPSGTCADVEVILKRSASTFSFFLPPVTITTRAAAARQVTGTCTDLSLSTSAKKAIYIQGSANVTVDSVCSNSNSPESIDIGGGNNAVLNAGELYTVGNYTTNPNSNFNVAGVWTDAPVFPDPWVGKIKYTQPTNSPQALNFANPQPSISVGGTTNNVAYCPFTVGNGQTVNFNPGVYIIEGEDNQKDGMTVQNGATVTGAGVTFIFTSVPTGATPCTGTSSPGGNFSLQGGMVTLSNPTADIGTGCPSSATCIPSGLLFYQDPATADTSCVKSQLQNSNCNVITAGAGSTLTGTSYTPATTVSFTGNSNSQCFLIVALQTTYIGNSTMKADVNKCKDVGVATLPEIWGAVLTE